MTDLRPSFENRARGLAINRPNYSAAGKAGIASLFAIEHLCPGLPEPVRWAA